MVEADQNHDAPQRLSRRSRWVFAALLLLALVLASSFTAVSYYFDQNRIRTQLIDQIEQWAGTRISADSAMTIRLFPRSQVVLRNVASVAETGPVTIKIDQVEVGFSAWKALFGQIDAQTIVLDKAIINVNLSARGAIEKWVSNNPLRPTIALATKQVSANMNQPDLSGIANRMLGSISMLNSSIIIGTGTGKTEIVSDVSASLIWPDLRGQARFTGSSQWRGEVVSFASNIEEPLIFSAGGNSAMTLDLVSKPLSLKFSGRTNLLADLFAEGDLSLKAPSLKQFLNWSRASSTAGETIGDITMDTHVTTKEGKLIFDNLALWVSGSPAMGTLEIDPVAKPIKTSGTLAFEDLDLIALANALPVGIGGEGQAELSGLDELDLDLRLSSTRAKLGDFSVINAAGAVRIAQGDASFDLGTAEFAGGTIMGRLELSGPAQSKIAKLALGASSVQLDQIEGVPEGLPIFVGPLSGKLMFSGPYKGLSDLVAKGDGTLAVDLGAGVMRNFNVESLQSEIKSGAMFELPQTYAGMSEVKNASVEGIVKQGVVFISKAEALINGHIVTFTGAMPLFSKGVALNGAIKDTEGRLPSVPFFIGGTWDMPLVTTTNPK